MVGGELVCENGRFTRIDRDATLEKLVQALSKPRTEAENHRRWLRREVFPQVKNFYRHYLDEEPAREPFYGNSSRR